MFDAFYSFLDKIGYLHPIHPAMTHMPIGLVVGSLFMGATALALSRPALADFPPPRSTKLLASTGLDGDFGFHKGGYIATCNKLNISSCSGVGVLFW